MEEEVVQTLSMHSGTTPSPGGGLAKPGYFDEDEIETDDDETNMAGYSPWKG